MATTSKKKTEEEVQKNTKGYAYNMSLNKNMTRNRDVYGSSAYRELSVSPVGTTYAGNSRANGSNDTAKYTSYSGTYGSGNAGGIYTPMTGASTSMEAPNVSSWLNKYNDFYNRNANYLSGNDYSKNEGTIANRRKNDITGLINDANQILDQFDRDENFRNQNMDLYNYVKDARRNLTGLEDYDPYSVYGDRKTWEEYKNIEGMTDAERRTYADNVNRGYSQDTEKRNRLSQIDTEIMDAEQAAMFSDADTYADALNRLQNLRAEKEVLESELSGNTASERQKDALDIYSMRRDYEDHRDLIDQYNASTLEEKYASAQDIDREIKDLKAERERINGILSDSMMDVSDPEYVRLTDELRTVDENIRDAEQRLSDVDTYVLKPAYYEDNRDKYRRKLQEAQADPNWNRYSVFDPQDTRNGLFDTDNNYAEVNAPNMGSSNQSDLFLYMTDEEKALYNYIHKTEGKAAADEYLDFMVVETSTRSRNANSERLRDLANKEGVAGAAANTAAFFGMSLANAYAGIAGYSDIARQNFERFDADTYRPINYNTTAQSIGQAVNDYRGFMGERLNAESPVLAYAYNIGTSIADSTTSMVASGFNEPLSLALMGSNAAQMGVYDALNRGADDRTALGVGFAYGVAEATFEKVSLENLWDTWKYDDIKGFVAATLQQAAIEGSEEMSTEITNMVSDALIMAERSDFNNSVNMYMNQGYSENDARKMAFNDCVSQVFESGVAGALSGGIQGGASNALHTMTVNADQRTQNPIIGNELIRSYGGDVDLAVSETLDRARGIYQSAEDTNDRYALGNKIADIQEKVDNGTEVTAEELGSLQRSVIINTFGDQASSIIRNIVDDSASAYNTIQQRNTEEYVPGTADTEAKTESKGRIAQAIENRRNVKQYSEDIRNNAETVKGDTITTVEAGRETVNRSYAELAGMTAAEQRQKKAVGSAVAEDAASKADPTVRQEYAAAAYKLLRNEELTPEEERLLTRDSAAFSVISEAMDRFPTDTYLRLKNDAYLNLETNDGNRIKEVFTDDSGNISARLETGGTVPVASLNVSESTKDALNVVRLYPSNVATSLLAAMPNENPMAFMKGASMAFQAAKDAIRNNEDVTEDLINRTETTEEFERSGLKTYVMQNAGEREKQTVRKEKITQKKGEADTDYAKRITNGQYVPGSYKGRTGVINNAANTTLSRSQQIQLDVLDEFLRKFGYTAVLVDEIALDEKNGMYLSEDGKTVVISAKALDSHENGSTYGYVWTAIHEITHSIRNQSEATYKVMRDMAEKMLGTDAMNEIVSRMTDRGMSEDAAMEEVVANTFAGIVNTEEGRNWLGRQVLSSNKIRNAVEKIVEALRDFLLEVEDFFKNLETRSPEARRIQNASIEQLNEALSVFENALNSTNTTALETVATVDTATESAAPTDNMSFSEKTWTESEYVTDMKNAAKDLAAKLKISQKQARKYIEDVNSIAKLIADDRARLDYISSPGRSSFVSNVEYGGSIDFSTICAKRRLLTGTFSEIQKALPNTALSADDILKIRNMMIDKGLEVNCGLCYVEGSRVSMGRFTREFLKQLKEFYPDMYQPNMAEMNTPDGIEWVRINHPDTYEQYEYFWNHYGKLKPATGKNLFASQQKPKLFQERTAYDGEILKEFKNSDTVEKKNLNGGLRIQSFSDFEIVHAIDMMQVVMDMSRVGLAGQAYTKVPEFAELLGNTGLKINLSLIAKDVDENGRLIFDDREGMPIARAMELRNKFSDNVGTITVVFNDKQLMAAMADERCDFIIPFHRSQWKKNQYAAMGLPSNTKDYTYQQNEKYLKKQYHEYRGRMVLDKAHNFMPNEYWDFSKSGKENAEAYLKLCAENNKRPKFYKLLTDNGDGSFSLKADGSTDGYWKMLIDFKMYNNDGVGIPQAPVRPTFNMTEAMDMLNNYKGGHSSFPVDYSVVDDFVSEYKENHKGAKFSDKVSADEYMSLAEQYRNNPNNENIRTELENMVRNAAANMMPNTKIVDEDGLPMIVYHGTSEEFTVFDRTKGRTNMDINGHFFSPWELDAEGYGENVGRYFINITNPASEGIAFKALNAHKGQNGAGIMAREDLERKGYDGVNNENEEFIAFNSYQIKSADPVTYDDSGNIIPLSERFNTDNNDIRWSEKYGPTQDGVNWTIEDDILNNQEIARFYSTVANISTGRYDSVEKAANGDYIVAVDNKLIYTDADLETPTISQVITFNTELENECDEARRHIYEAEKGKYTFTEAMRVIEAYFGVGFADIRTIEDSGYSGRKNRRGEGKNSGGSYNRTEKEVQFIKYVADGRIIHYTDGTRVKEYKNGKKRNLKSVKSSDKVSTDTTELNSYPVVSTPNFVITEGDLVEERNRINRMRKENELLSKILSHRQVMYRLGSDFRAEKTELVPAITKYLREIGSEYNPGTVAEVMYAIADYARVDRVGKTNREAMYNTIARQIAETLSQTDDAIEAQRMLDNIDIESAGPDSKELIDELQARASIVDYVNTAITLDEAEMLIAADLERIYNQMPLAMLAKRASNISSDQAKAWKQKYEAANKMEQRLRKELEQYKKLSLPQYKKQIQKSAVDKYKDLQKRNKNLREIERISYALGNKIGRPSDRNHMPTYLAAPIGNLLMKLDIGNLGGEGKEILPSGAKAPVRWEQVFEDVRRAVAKIEAAQDPTTGLSQAELESKERIEANSKRNLFDRRNDQYTVDPELLNNIENIIEEIRAMPNYNDITTKGIKGMSNENVERTKNMLAAVNKMVETVNELHTNGRYTNVYRLAEAADKEMKERAALKKTLPMLSGIERIALDTMTPVTVFERLGGASETVLESIMDGYDKRLQLLNITKNAVDDLMGDAEYWKWEDKRVKIKLPTKDIELTQAQAMNLYLLANRREAHKHLSANGIILPADKKSAKEQRIRLKTEDITALREGRYLTEEQKRVADGLQKFISTEATSWGNETSRLLFGYDKFTEEDYWPMKTDPRSRDAKVTSRQAGADQVNAIKNFGSGKGLNRNAGNALTVESAMAIFSDHITEMATYRGLAAPYEDFMKWFNFRDEYRDKSGAVYRNAHIREDIDSILGESYSLDKTGRVKSQNGGESYMIALMKEINGMMDPSDMPSWLNPNKYLGNVKGSMVGFKTRVAIQQPISVIRAADVIDPKYLTQAYIGKLGGTPKDGDLNLHASMLKHNEIGIWKEWGGYDANSKTNIQGILFDHKNLLGKISDASGALAEKGDSFTWSKMWRAAQLQIADTTNLQWGTDEFYAEAAGLFRKTIYATQVVDSPFTKPPILKSKNFFVKAWTAFQAENAQTLNLLYRTGSRAAYDIKHGNKAAGAKKIAKASVIFVMTGALNALVTSAYDAWKKKYKDDDEKKYSEYFLEQFGSSFKDNMFLAGYVPFLNNVIDAIKEGEFEDLTIGQLNNTLTYLKNFYKLVSSGENKSTRSIYYTSKKALETVGSIFGLPIQGLITSIEDVYGTIAELTKLPKIPEYRRDHVNKTVYESFFAAVDSGDAAEYERYVRILHDKGLDNKTIQQKLVDHLVEDERVIEASTDLYKNNGTFPEYRLRRDAIVAEIALATGKDVAEEIVDGALNRVTKALNRGETVKPNIKEAVDYDTDETGYEAELNYSTVVKARVSTDMDAGIITESSKSAVREWKEMLMEEKGKSEKEANSTIRTSINSMYRDAWIEGNAYERERIENLLMQYDIGYSDKTFQKWAEKADEEQ